MTDEEYELIVGNTSSTINGPPSPTGEGLLSLHASKFAKGSKKEIPQVELATPSNARDFGMTD